MTPEQFCYWLQCLAEIQEQGPDEKQWQIVKDHLATVFVKQTPNRKQGLADSVQFKDLMTTRIC